MFKPVQRLHRVVGLFSMILVVFMTVTGLLLNHREELSLDERYATNPVVVGLYDGFNGEDSREGGYLEEPPTWERVLTALHAGRILGRPFSLLIDLGGAVLLFLSFTGLYLWLKRTLVLRETNRAVEGEVLIQKAEQLMKIQQSTRELLGRAGKIHDLSEHVMTHIKDAPGGDSFRGVGEIERYLKGLDGSMHALIEKLERLEKDARQE